MKEKLKLEYFKQYLGSDIEYEIIFGDEAQIRTDKLIGINIHNGELTVLNYNSFENIIDFDENAPSLVLRSVFDITHEEAIKVCCIEWPIFDNTGCRFVVVRKPFGRQLIKVHVFEGEKHLHEFELNLASLHQQALDYLRSIHVSLPLYDSETNIMIPIKDLMSEGLIKKQEKEQWI